MYSCANCDHLKVISPVGVDLDDYVVCKLSDTDLHKVPFDQAHLWGTGCSKHANRVKKEQFRPSYRLKVIECCVTCKFGQVIPPQLRLLAPNTEFKAGYCTFEQPDESTVDTWHAYVRKWQVDQNGYCDHYKDTD